MPEVDPQRTQGTKGALAGWRWIGFVVSVILIAAAVWAVRGQWGSFREVERAIETGRLWLVLAAVGLPVLNWLLTSGVFYFLTLPRAPRPGVETVSLREMTLLIGSAWLLNYLPLSPGMLGRVAYHRAVHRIPVVATLGVLVSALLIGVAVVGCVLIVVLAAGHRTGLYVPLLGTPLAMLFGAAVVLRKGNQRLGAWRYAAAAGLRWLDVLVWMARYAVVFSLLGRSLTLAEAAAIAAASQAAMQVPLVGNGLGVREWAVGLVGPMLPAWMSGGEAGVSQGLGLSADLLNRGLELAAAIPVGLLCTTLLAGRHRHGSAERQPESHP